MNNPLSLPNNDLDETMLKVARSLSMDIYPLDEILAQHNVPTVEFYKWSQHPRFQQYLTSEKEAWNSANNTNERTKVKAGIVMENFMEEAHTLLHSKTSPLNHRVELAKVVARIAGMGEQRMAGVASSGSGFNLQINIGSGAGERRIVIAPEFKPTKTIDANDYGEYDGYDPFTSPNTLDD